DVLDDGQDRLDVVVGDGAGLGLTEGDGPRAVGRVALGVAGGAALAHRVGPGVDGDGGRAEERRVAGRGGAVAGHGHGEVGGGRRAPVVVDDVLDHVEGGGLVVVGDGAGLGLTEGDGTGAVGGEARGVAGGAALPDRVGPGVDGDGGAG